MMPIELLENWEVNNMTMHLATGFNSLRNKKYKPKMTKANIAKWQQELIQHNRSLKSMGQPKMTFDQYVDYCHGLGPKVTHTCSKQSVSYTATKQQPYVRNSGVNYPSAPMSASGDTAKKEPLYYTGERKLLGVATMHKSNAVPIFADDKQQAIDIARMRR
jgi:hypothetical protein